MKRLLVLLAAGCSSGHDVVGPFSGPVTRFVVDAIRVPMTTADSMEMGDDLDGNGTIDDKLGAATSGLLVTNDLSLDGADMIASGALASVVELQIAGGTAGVTFFGADGDAATACGATVIGGAIATNRTRETEHPCAAIVRLPIFTNADPVALPIDAVEVDLAPDGDGYAGYVRGGIRLEAARAAAYTGLLQMIADEPERHVVFERGVDQDGDGLISRDEADGSLVGLLVAADIQLFQGDAFAPVPGSQFRDSVSIGFAIHLAPAVTAAPVNTCRDRIRDGDETDIDCGGACHACKPGAHCSVAADCQSNACDAGACRAPSCSDGVRDGIESDIDCGGTCGKCATGQTCAATSDCATGTCTSGIGTLGHCGG